MAYCLHTASCGHPCAMPFGHGSACDCRSPACPHSTIFEGQIFLSKESLKKIYADVIQVPVKAFVAGVEAGYKEAAAELPKEEERYECGHYLHEHTPNEMFMQGPCAKLEQSAPPERPSWDKIWMDFASTLALRSTCRRASVGCVVVSMDNSTVMGLGYNGGPKGGRNTCLSDEPGKCGHLHAEINALIKANYRDAAPRKAYLTLSPCVPCATALVNFGVEEVVYRVLYRDDAGLEILRNASYPIRVRQFDPTWVRQGDLYLQQDRKD